MVGGRSEEIWRWGYPSPIIPTIGYPPTLTHVTPTPHLPHILLFTFSAALPSQLLPSQHTHTLLLKVAPLPPPGGLVCGHVPAIGQGSHVSASTNRRLLTPPHSLAGISLPRGGIRVSAPQAQMTVVPGRVPNTAFSLTIRLLPH